MTSPLKPADTSAMEEEEPKMTDREPPMGEAVAPRTPDERPEDKNASRPSGWNPLDLAEAYALVVLTGLVVLIFGLLPASSDSFLTSTNLQIVLADQSILALVALAVLFPIIAGSWDFSSAANAGFAAIMAASVAGSSGSVVLGLTAAVGVGVAIGVVNGLLVTAARINSVIATLGMTTVIAGLVQWKTDGTSITEGVPDAFARFGSTELLGIPKLAWAALIVILLAYYVLRYTPFGRYLYAIGSNSTAAELVGLPVGRFRFLTFVGGGLLAGLAGALILSRTGAGNPAVGPDLIIPAYAAVFLGATAVKPGRWNVGGVVVSILFLGALNSGLTLAGANPYVNLLVNGGALLAGVGVANLLARQRGRALTTKW